MSVGVTERVRSKPREENTQAHLQFLYIAEVTKALDVAEFSYFHLINYFKVRCRWTDVRLINMLL